MAPLRFEPRRSLWLAALLLLSHGGALALLVFMPLIVWIKLLLACALLVSLASTLSIHALLRGKCAVVSVVVCDDAGRWLLRTTDGRELAARLLPGSYVSLHLVILRFRLTGSRWRQRSVVLLSDALDDRSLRRLRVYLINVGIDPPE